MSLDLIYSRWANRHPFFSEGWGRRDILDDLLKQGARKLNQRLARRKLPPARIAWTPARGMGHSLVREGVFESPHYYEWKPARAAKRRECLPPEIAFARVQLIQPRHQQGGTRPLVIHFAATGDEAFGRRRKTLALPLARRGISSVLIENPYYGQRRPPGQIGSRLRNVTEFLQMARAAQDEGHVLLDYFRALGYGPIGVTGVSMGGYSALMMGAEAAFPVAVSACIPTHSAAPVYTEGVLSLACDWNALHAHLEGRGNGDPRDYMFRLFSLSDLDHLPAPKWSRAAVLVGAEDDRYIPRASVESAHAHWPGSELRWIKGGHVSSFLFNRKDFIQAIVDSLDRIVDFPGTPLPPARSI